MNGTPSTSTAPVMPPRDRAYWTRVIHNAAKVTPEHPRYGEARQVVQLALENLDALQQGNNAADTPAPVMPSKLRGAAMNALQGLTLGTGDEALGGIAGLGTLMTGGGMDQAAARVQQTQEGFREQRGNFFGQHPGIAIASDLYGTMANPLNKVLGPLTEGLGPVAKGAAIGTTLGGIRGFGEGTGSAKERLPSAAIGAAIGLIAGSTLGKAVKIVGPTIGKLVQNAQRVLGPKATPSAIANTVETSIRARLTKLNVPADDIERAIESWRTTGELSVRRLAETHPPIPPQPIAVRPGEAIDPLGTPTFERAGGKVRTIGQTLGTGDLAPLPPSWQGTTPQAGGVGGHSYSGTYPATPPDALAFLQSGSPQELLAKLTTLQGLGVRELPGTMPDLLQRLLGGR